MASLQNPNRNAWVQLYEARRVPNEPEVRSPGRPPGIVPRRKVGLTLSQGEITELENWRERFSRMLHRSVSTGETVGILTRICTARFARMKDDEGMEALAALVERLVGEE
ncbi:MAG: hypothetical protein KBF64_08125 [Anaerolineaceae bacterium]|jgi:hypothetical protein|nr:hypothetical protein [Anaerolineaceae bacterium]